MAGLENEVLAAADRLVSAFGDFERDDYFSCFAEDATFTFYNYPERLTSRSAYERVWDGWVADGWRVSSCFSTNRSVQELTSDVAIFTHDVSTTFAGDDPEPILERESIVFVRRDGWVAVHEHLSPIPD